MKLDIFDVFLLVFGICYLIFAPNYWWLGLVIIIVILLTGFMKVKIERLKKENKEMIEAIARITGEHK